MSEVQVIDRAFALIELLLDDNRPVHRGMSELARQSGMHVATVRRLLSSLKAHGVVSQDPVTRKYTLGLTMIRYGVAVWQAVPIREYARAPMERLWKNTGETVYLVVREGDCGVLVDKIDTPDPVKLVEPLGKRAPLYAGAAKKAILAFLPEHTREDLIKSYVYEKHGPRTPENARQLRFQLEQVQKDGYAVSHEEVTRGTTAIAAPIFNARGQPVAALSVDGPSYRFHPNRVDQLIEKVRSAAQEVSTALRLTGYGLLDSP
ncbi:MAG: IclR family transcriptional regulator [Firmicutes bacterium]|nr:IclR family transcriptional regulator [Bacillota bacterium]